MRLVALFKMPYIRPAKADTQFGGNSMQLIEAIAKLQDLDQDSTIYASEPFTAESNVVVEREAEDGGVPVSLRGKGFKYFLEVDLVREFVEDLLVDKGAAQTTEEICARLIRYAIDDA